MATVKTNDLRTKNTEMFIESFNEDNGYMFIGRSTPWPNDEEPPVPTNNLEEYYEVHDEMLSLKRVMESDVHFMIPHVKWISGTTFDMYRHDYSEKRRAHSGANNLYDAIFYCLSSNNHVYVCLNNNDTASLVEPQNLEDKPFTTSDGYQWLKLYRLNKEDREDFSTLNLMPITGTESVTTIPGAVYTIVIDSPGFGYTNLPTGMTEVRSYFCHIRGDGIGGVARVSVANEEVVDVEVVRGGLGYTFASVDFSPNNVYASIIELDENRNGLNPMGQGFRSTVIISPPGGWGSDLPYELCSRTAGVFSSFKDPLMDAYPDTTFRQIGILHDPEFSDDENADALSLSAVHSVKLSATEGLPFQIGDVIRQEVEEGVVAHGRVVSFDEEFLVLRYIINKTTVDEYGRALVLRGDAPILARVDRTVGYPQTNYNNWLLGTTFSKGYAEPEIKKHRGNLTYLSNIKPVKRAPTQTERVSLTISF